MRRVWRTAGMTAFLFFAAGPAIAGNAQNQDVYRYLSDYIDSLSLYHQSRQRVHIMEEALSDPSTAVAFAPGILVQIQEANDLLNHATHTLDPYHQSDNDMVITTLMSAVMAYHRQSQANIQQIKRLDFLKKKGAQAAGTEEFKLMTAAVQAQENRSLEILIHSAEMVTYLLIGREPDKKGRMRKLTITEKEKEDLIARLDGKFGEILTRELTKDMPLSLAPAMILRSFLAKPSWQTANRK